MPVLLKLLIVAEHTPLALKMTYACEKKLLPLNRNPSLLLNPITQFCVPRITNSEETDPAVNLFKANTRG